MVVVGEISVEENPMEDEDHFSGGDGEDEHGDHVSGDDDERGDQYEPVGSVADVRWVRPHLKHRKLPPLNSEV